MRDVMSYAMRNLTDPKDRFGITFARDIDHAGSAGHERINGHC
jgi:hypothetical protein